jgi:hypothetical protein
MRQKRRQLKLFMRQEFSLINTSLQRGDQRFVPGPNRFSGFWYVQTRCDGPETAEAVWEALSAGRHLAGARC